MFALLLWALGAALHAYVASSAAPRFWAGPVRQLLQTFDGTSAPCRIVMVGSSPVVFGLSAAQMQAATGCAAVNLGLIDIGQQVERYLVDLLPLVRPGDYVVLSDRSWVDQSADENLCTDKPQWACFLVSLRPVPNLAQDFRNIGGGSRRRTMQGDLVDYAVTGIQLQRSGIAAADDIDARVGRMARQAALIQARGAFPVMAPTPMLANSATRPIFARQLAFLSERMRASIGIGIWLDPPLETDASLFSPEGRHSSETGRARWTHQVASELLAVRAQTPR